MSRSVLAALCLFSIAGHGVLFGQNKTLGVGIATPNANAALHVESPTGNQGFIMPRLTTLQREAMSALLTASDKGLILYDTDANAIYIWDGIVWESSSQFTVNDPASTQEAISVLTMGSGVASKFTINNVSSLSHAVYGENNGDSTSAAVHGNHTGNGFGIFGKSAGSKFASAAVYGEHVGTGDAAGAFRISNSTNNNSALFGETNGGGSAIFGNQIGLGRAGQFQITNTLNAEAAIRAYTSGTGYSGFYTINNPQSTSAGIFSTTNGSGAAIFAQNAGAADGFAGLFNVTQTTNTYPAIQASTMGTGSGVRVMQDQGTGPGIDVFMHNVNSSAAGFSASQMGQGSASIFEINNVNSRAPSVYAITNGSGYAIHAAHKGTAGDAIYAETTSTGSAGNFRITNPNNTASSVYAATNAAAGAAIGAANDANGLGLAVWSGGMKVSTNQLSTGTSITVRASAYLISGGGPYSFGFIMNEGEIFYFYNNTAADVVVDKLTIPANSGKTCIFLGAALRAL